MPEKTKRKRKRKSVLASAPAYKPEPQRVLQHLEHQQK
jgi:hypothetical protein